MRRDRPGAARSRGPAAGLATAGLLVVAANRVLGTTHHRGLVGLQAVTRWALLPAHVLLPLAAIRGQPRVAVAAAGLAGYQLGLTRSARGRVEPDPAPPTGVAVSLVSANLLLTNPRVVDAGRRLLEDPVDVLALQELTPEHLAALEGAGLLDRFPYAVTAPEPGYHGAGLFSRWPLAEAAVVDLEGVPFPAATVLTPGGRLRVVVVHAKNPGAAGQLPRWRRQLAALAELVSRSRDPTVLVGDYNATGDHRDLRRLVSVGLRDAWDVAGRGAGATWPVWAGPVPPLLRLDHALVGPGVAVRSAVVRDSPGSDHRHLRVELHVGPSS